MVRKVWDFPRDYLLPSPTDRGLGYGAKPMAHLDASILTTTILRDLPDPTSTGGAVSFIHPRVAEAYYTEHGGESFLPSAAGCLNMDPALIGLLG